MRYGKCVLGVALSVSLTTGCALLIGIEPFPEGGQPGSEGGINCSDVNDCKKAQLREDDDQTGISTVDIPISANSTPLCQLISSGTIVRFKANDGLCRLRGGVIQSGQEIIQNENIIEMQFDNGTDIDSTMNVEIKIDTGAACIPYFCEHDPSMRHGTIFVQ